jgi:hypothetical protein
VRIEMDEETRKALEELPDSKGCKRKEWSSDMDTALLKHWPRAKQSDVARLLEVSEDTARTRYRFLIRKEV